MGEFFEIPKELVLEGLERCFDNALNLSKKAEPIAYQVMESGIEEPIAIGLFSFAIEEVGKGLLLQDCLSQDGQKCKIPKELFIGRNSHNLKFKRALETLPEECSSVAKPVSYELTTTKDGKKKIAGPDDEVTELVCGGTFVHVDFNTRMDCFYVDWDEVNNCWKNPSHVMPFHLHPAIKKFQDVVVKLKNSGNLDTKG